MILLEEVIRKALPGCGLKAIPYIVSRLKTLVRKFRAISLMLSTSGFGWEDDKKTISVKDQRMTNIARYDQNFFVSYLFIIFYATLVCIVFNVFFSDSYFIQEPVRNCISILQ